MENRQNIILFGYKGSGKTFLGKLLAEELGKDFIDTDRLIEKLYTQEFNEVDNCRQIFLKLGDDGFRRLEERAIDQLQCVKGSIIAIGGGTLLNQKNCLKLKKLGKLIYLEVDKETIKQRIFESGIPSFLNSEDPENSFEAMYATRKSHYENISSHKIEIYNKTNDHNLALLKKMMKEPF